MNISNYNSLVGRLWDEFQQTGLGVSMYFQWAIRKQNEIYELPISTTPTLSNLGESPVKRMEGFMKTLEKEMQEGLEILAMMKFKEAVDTETFDFDLPSVPTAAILDFYKAQGVTDEKRLNTLTRITYTSYMHSEDSETEFERQILVAQADWLADMQVYNRSEALKYGIPLESVLMCVMGSNFTKLDENNQPIKDGNGKFLKGPNYEAPEDHIYATMFGQHDLLMEASDVIAQASSIETLSVTALDDPMFEVHEACGAFDEDDVDYIEGSDEVYDEEGEE